MIDYFVESAKGEKLEQLHLGSFGYSVNWVCFAYLFVSRERWGEEGEEALLVKLGSFYIILDARFYLGHRLILGC